MHDCAHAHTRRRIHSLTHPRRRLPLAERTPQHSVSALTTTRAWSRTLSEDVRATECCKRACQGCRLPPPALCRFVSSGQLPSSSKTGRPCSGNTLDPLHDSYTTPSATPGNATRVAHRSTTLALCHDSLALSIARALVLSRSARAPHLLTRSHASPMLGEALARLVWQFSALRPLGALCSRRRPQSAILATSPHD